MKVYTNEEYSNAMFKDKLLFKCDQCGIEYKKSKSYAYIASLKSRQNNFCSKKCNNLFNTKTTIRKCKICSKETTNKAFCCRSCAAIFTNSKRVYKMNEKKCINCGQLYKDNWKNSPQQFCSMKCSGEYRSKKIYEKNLKLFQEGKLKYRKWIYDILIKENGNRCSVCEITEWNNKPIRLWVDHVNGDPSDNSPSNFRLICPNCESQTDTSRGRNYGYGRKSKGLPCYG